MFVLDVLSRGARLAPPARQAAGLTRARCLPSAPVCPLPCPIPCPRCRPYVWLHHAGQPDWRDAACLVPQGAHPTGCGPWAPAGAAHTCAACGAGATLAEAAAPAIPPFSPLPATRCRGPRRHAPPPTPVPHTPPPLLWSRCLAAPCAHSLPCRHSPSPPHTPCCPWLTLPLGLLLLVSNKRVYC